MATRQSSRLGGWGDIRGVDTVSRLFYKVTRLVTGGSVRLNPRHLPADSVS
jgi:hypothetical protein